MGSTPTRFRQPQNERASPHLSAVRVVVVRVRDVRVIVDETRVAVGMAVRLVDRSLVLVPVVLVVDVRVLVLHRLVDVRVRVPRPVSLA